MQPSSLIDEAIFHDEWAETIDPCDVMVEETFRSPVSAENLFIMKEIGDVRGLQVLELGTGLGEGATYFAKMGARVHATDLSVGMLLVAKRVADKHQTYFTSNLVDAARLSFKPEAFDLVYAANTLHHVNIHECLCEVYRVLKPGGRAAFWDPVKYNPLINSYRRMAHQVRTDDEHPLGRTDLAMMRSMFSRVRVDFFGLATLGVFLKFYFVDMIHPNEERYWKKIVADYQSFRHIYSFLRGVDRIILGLPGIRWMAWNIAVVLTK